MLGSGGLAAPQVEYFINLDRFWNVEQIREWFVYVDEVDTLNIPLHSRVEEDILFWFHDPKCHYSVMKGFMELYQKRKDGVAVDLCW